mgnify:CR=1 FL=1
MARAKPEKQAVGSQNRTVTPNEAKLALEHCIKLQRPIMMWGAPGIGKSDIVKQIADKQKKEVIFSRDISSTTQNYGQDILICDDLVDTGNSLIYTKKFLLDYESFKGKNINFKTAVLYRKPKSKIIPDYVIHDMKTNDWLVFFYEESELITIPDLKNKYSK